MTLTIQRPLQIHIDNPPGLHTLLQLPLAADIQYGTRFHDACIRNHKIDPPPLESRLCRLEKVLHLREIQDVNTHEDRILGVLEACDELGGRGVLRGEVGKDDIGAVGVVQRRDAGADAVCCARDEGGLARGLGEECWIEHCFGRVHCLLSVMRELDWAVRRDNSRAYR